MKSIITEKQLGLLRRYMKTFINEGSDLKKNPSHDRMREDVIYFLKTLGFFKTDNYGLADVNNDGVNDTEMFTFEKGGIKVFIGVTSRIDNENVFYTVFIRLNNNEYPLRPTTFNTLRELENSLTNILRDLEDKNKLVDLGIKEPGEPKPYNKANMSTELVNQAKDYMSKFVNENKKNMKLVITESQYRKLQRVLREEELNEASLGKKLGMAALGAGLSFGSPEARGQQVEPTGKFTYYYNDGTMTVENNVLYLNNDDAIEGAMSYVFTQSNFKNARIPVVLGRTGDIENLDEVKRKFSRMLIDTIHGGENIEGTFKTMSGYRSEEDIKKGGFLKLLRNMFRKQANIKIRNVVFDDNQFRKFIKRAARGRANFIIKNGMLMYNPQADLNEASFGKKLGMGALGAGLALGSAKGQDIEPTGKFTFPTDYGRKDKVVIDSNIVNITSPTQIADIVAMVLTQYDSLEIPIDRENIGKTNFILKNVMIDSLYGGKNLYGYYRVPKGYRSEDEILKAPLNKKIWGLLKSMFGENVRLPIKDVRMDDNTVMRFLKLIDSNQTSFSIRMDRNGREVIYNENQY